MSKLTQAQVDEMAVLREDGWSFGRLARRYGVSEGAIHYRCLTVGALSPRSRPLAGAERVIEATGFGGRVRRFTQAEDAKLLQLARAGLRVDAIAETMRRARSTVRVRLLTLEAKAELA